MVVPIEQAVQVSVVPDRVLDRSLAETDPEVHRAISAELTRADWLLDAALEFTGPGSTATQE